jgi:EpsD family peptidyl-prolyl cis-trans isomerase
MPRLGSTEVELNSRTLLIALAAGACLTAGGCDKIKHLMGGKPSGQVVATVNGQEITNLELKSEMGGFASKDPKVMKQAQQQALQTIILRRLVAQQAKTDKLDKTPDYTIQVQRGEETLLAQMFERKIAATLTPPTQRDADNYVAEHPDQFANRRILALDQIMAQPSKVAPEKFKDLKTLEDVKRLMEAENVPYQEGSSELDTLSAPPNLIAAINKLPPGEVFLLPQRGVLVFNRVAGAKSAPFRGDLATNYAMRLLGQQRAQGAVRTRLEAMRKAADSKIVYSADFKPPPPSAATVAPAPGAPAAAPAAAPAKK